MSAAPAPGEPEGKLAIGAMSRATGIPVETLRTWELRHGFPVPERKPSGHRVYPLSLVPRLRRILELINRGHRAGEVVPASDQVLQALLDATAKRTHRTIPSSEPRDGAVTDLLQAVESLDGDRLTRLLLGDWARLGPHAFLQARVAPLVRAVGDAWADGALDVAHEHFLAERVGDLLRTLRLPLEERARGPVVVLATLPGERHSLGLQMAALCLAHAGCRLVYLGTEVPLGDLTRAAGEAGARAVCVSVSAATRGARTGTRLAQLRRRLPRRIALVVGGDGAPPPRRGIEVIQDLEALDAFGRRLVHSV
jgi:methanogenic corrinoid protein MtbC1